MVQGRPGEVPNVEETKHVSKVHFEGLIKNYFQTEIDQNPQI